MTDQLTRQYHGHTIVSTAGHQKLVKNDDGETVDVSDGWSHVLQATGEQFDTLGLAIAAAKANPVKPPEETEAAQKPAKPKRK